VLDQLEVEEAAPPHRIAEARAELSVATLLTTGLVR
jgi:hypothetical protein